MAVTKTHPIKSTLKAALDYILNPEKTDGKLLASSFGCGLETADIEFAWTREAAGDRGTHLGRHLIQSFAVGEPHRKKRTKSAWNLPVAVLGGKYEFVLTTHVDKDHLHNHLISTRLASLTTKSTIPTSKAITLSGAPATGYVKCMGYPSSCRDRRKGKVMRNIPPKSKGQATKPS